MLFFKLLKLFLFALIGSKSVRKLKWGKGEGVTCQLALQKVAKTEWYSEVESI